eukprot:GHVP01020866.1.p1 GENE.GHVP01020866.1~~GHVP01020866.1.p1  ORF type:complete len:270 (+),score=32.05 GHVP01020866.1:41-850(+)
MEFKLLFDQLNSACEDFCGVPHGNGFPVHDDLNHGNLEPEFRVRKLRFGTTVQDNTEPRVGNSINCIMQQLQTIIPYDKRFEVNWLKGFLTFGSDDTILYVQEPEYFNGRRLWTIWICNCRNPDIIRNVLKGTQCESEKCAKLSVTYKDTLEEAELLDAAQYLWWWFECCPKVVEDLHFFQSKFHFGNKNLKTGNPKAWKENEDYRRKHFEPIWDQIWALHCLYKKTALMEHLCGAETSSEASSDSTVASPPNLKENVFSFPAVTSPEE